MQYNVYRLGAEDIIIQSFATQALAQAFIDSQAYDDAGLFIIYE